MPVLCKECRHFFTDYKKLKPDIGEHIPKTDNKPSDYISQPKCMLGNKIAESTVGWVPFTHDYTCIDFMKK